MSLNQKNIKSLIKKLQSDEEINSIIDKYKLDARKALVVLKKILLEPEVYAPHIYQNYVDHMEAEKSIYIKKYRELAKKLAHYDMVMKHLENYIKTYKPPKYKGIPAPKAQHHKKYHPVLVISDAHIGEKVNMDFYEYDIKRARDIARRIVLGTLEIVGQKHYKNHLTVFMLGDMVSGIIHEELLRGADLVPADQVVEAAAITAWMLNELSRFFKQITVFGVVGNHGRFFKKPYFKEKYNSLDYVMYNLAEAYTRQNPRITWVLPKHSYAIVNIEGYNFFLHHGDNIRAWAGIPYYGINRADNNYAVSIMRYTKQEIHYFVRGHFHSTMTAAAPLGMTIVNGAWKAIDEYVFEGAVFKPTPVQLFLSVCKDRGITAIDYIHLE